MSAPVDIEALLSTAQDAVLRLTDKVRSLVVTLEDERAVAQAAHLRAEAAFDGARIKSIGLELRAASLEGHLRMLLALVHRDGGKHTEEAGLEQSFMDAREVCANWEARLRSLEESIDGWAKRFSMQQELTVRMGDRLRAFSKWAQEVRFNEGTDFCRAQREAMQLLEQAETEGQS